MSWRSLISREEKFSRCRERSFRVVEMVFSEYKKQRILYYNLQGFKVPTIAKLLQEEGMSACSRRGIAKFLKRYRETGTIARRPGSGPPSKITAEVKRIVEERMRADDETTAVQLHAHLNSLGYSLSLATILRCRSALGWTFRGSSYCQLIREANKTKRLEWARKNEGEAAEGFLDVIWSDECSIQLETHKRFCCRKRGEPPKNKPRYYVTMTYLSILVYSQIMCLCVYCFDNIFPLHAEPSIQRRFMYGLVSV